MTEPDGKTWLVFTPREPEVGDVIHYAELGEPVPSATPPLDIKQPAHRGTSNGNARGSSADRRARRAWIVLSYASDIPGFCRCYRCGRLLFNPDAQEVDPVTGQLKFTNAFVLLWGTQVFTAEALTIDRIIPGVKGGTYRRNNIRPACAGCNSETGGALSHSKKRNTK